MLFQKHSRKALPAYPAPCRTSYRWLVLALVWLLYVCHGIILRSASPLVTPMLKDLNMSYSQMGFVLGSWQLTYLLVAIAAGIIIDKWGLRKSLFIGTLIISLSAALRYFAQDFGTLLPTVALFGVGGPMISIGAPKAIALFFIGKERGTAVGIYTTGPWVGQMTVLAATNTVVMPLTGYSWRLTFFIYGVFTLAAALLWWFFSQEADPVENSKSFNFYEVIRHLLKLHNVRVILLLFGIAGGSLVALLILTLMETPGVDSQFMGAAGGIFFCISEIGGFFGPFIVGYLVDLTGSFMAGAIFLALLGAVIAALTAPLKTVSVAPSKAG